jgi:O-6-methylguanine DNA methyltransferase
METPLGLAFLFFSSKGLQRLAFAGEKDFKEGVVMGSTAETQALPPGVLKNWHDRVAQALEDYFHGNPAPFPALDLDLQGTPFQLRVWQELRKIPYGETVSYQELARRLKNPKASRAVGRACGANPIPLIIPCHRVIAGDGSLGGFSSGLARKRWLLEHEKVDI